MHCLLSSSFPLFRREWVVRLETSFHTTSGLLNMFANVCEDSVYDSDVGLEDVFIYFPCQFEQMVKKHEQL